MPNEPKFVKQHIWCSWSDCPCVAEVVVINVETDVKLGHYCDHHADKLIAVLTSKG